MFEENIIHLFVLLLHSNYCTNILYDNPDVDTVAANAKGLAKAQKFTALVHHFNLDEAKSQETSTCCELTTNTLNMVSLFLWYCMDNWNNFIINELKQENLKYNLPCMHGMANPFHLPCMCVSDTSRAQSPPYFCPSTWY